MGRFLDSLKKGLDAASSHGGGPNGYELEGRRIVCPHCGHDQFAEGRAQLNTAGMTFLNLDWLNRSATTLACAECGRIEWFLQEPQRVD